MSRVPHERSRLQFTASTGSTNGDLLQRVRAGDYLYEGDWWIADRQTAGKGRQGRAWQDGHGNFMGSTVVRLSANDPAPATLSLAAGLALFEAVLPLVPAQAQARLKWPNDLMLGGAKLAGILLERSGEFVVVGFGVNLTHAPEVEGRATAALIQYGPAPDRDVFASSLARALSEELTRWRTYGVDALLTRWQAAAHPVGTELTVAGLGEKPVRGHFSGLTTDGSLKLETGDGEPRLVRAGDITIGAEGWHGAAGN